MAARNSSTWKPQKTEKVTSVLLCQAPVIRIAIPQGGNWTGFVATQHALSKIPRPDAGLLGKSAVVIK